MSYSSDFDERDRQRREELLKAERDRMKKIIIKVIEGFIGLFLLIGLWSSFFTVEEGHVGIVKRFSEAKYQVTPGLHFKVPFIDDVEPIEVRTRKNEENMASATAEQMPLKVSVSVNWTVDREAALDLFKRYGGLTQFEQRILDPRFRAAAKGAIPLYTAEQLVQNRANCINKIELALVEEMKDFPVKVDNVQIENITLPPKYVESIEAKQTAKNLADAEQFKLNRQKLEAMRDVNTADAKAQSIQKVAAAEAGAIRVKGAAEAAAIEAKGKALRDNPLIVELTKAQQWNGVLPQTILGGSNIPILDMRK